MVSTDKLLVALLAGLHWVVEASLRPLEARGGPGNHAGSGTTGMAVRSACCSRSPFLPTLQGIESVEQIVSLCQSDLEAVRVSAREATLSFGKVCLRGRGVPGFQWRSGRLPQLSVPGCLGPCYMPHYA